MIEELKIILDSIGDLTGIALWIVAAFIAYKLVIMLATTGSIVFIARLLIERGHDALTRKLPSQDEIKAQEKLLKAQEKLLDAKRDGIGRAEPILANCAVLIRQYKQTQNLSGYSDYFHVADAERLERALMRGLEQQEATTNEQ